MIKCPMCDNTTKFDGNAISTTEVALILDGKEGDFHMEGDGETVVEELTYVTCCSCRHSGYPFLFGIGDLPGKAICVHEKTEIGEAYVGIVLFTEGTAQAAVEDFLDEETDKGGAFDWFFMDVDIATQIEREVTIPVPDRDDGEHELDWIKHTALLMCQAFSIEDPDEESDE